MFSHRELARRCRDLLVQQAVEDDCDLYAYWPMPDHVHLLPSPSDPWRGSEIYRFDARAGRAGRSR